MQVCEICGKERIFKSHLFTGEILGGKELKTWIYQCDCPQLMLDEITFIRDNKLKLTVDQSFKLRNLKAQKQTVYDEKNINYDDYKTWNTMRKSDIATKMDKNGEKIGTEMNLLYSPEVAKIHGEIWYHLYEYEKIREGK